MAKAIRQQINRHLGEVISQKLLHTERDVKAAVEYATKSLHGIHDNGQGFDQFKGSDSKAHVAYIASSLPSDLCPLRSHQGALLKVKESVEGFFFVIIQQGEHDRGNTCIHSQSYRQS